MGQRSRKAAEEERPTAEALQGLQVDRHGHARLRLRWKAQNTGKAIQQSYRIYSQKGGGDGGWLVHVPDTGAPVPLHVTGSAAACQVHSVDCILQRNEPVYSLTPSVRRRCVWCGLLPSSCVVAAS